MKLPQQPAPAGLIMLGAVRFMCHAADSVGVVKSALPYLSLSYDGLIISI